MNEDELGDLECMYNTCQTATTKDHKNSFTKLNLTRENTPFTYYV